MDTKSLINQRFKEAVNWLIQNKKAKNKAEIAETINVKPAKFSEILNKRMSIGIEDLAQFAEKYRLDCNWILLGKGNLEESIKEDLSKEPEPGYVNIELIATQRELLKMKDQRIAELEEKLAIKSGKRQTG